MLSKTSLFVPALAALASTAAAQLSNANDDPNLSERDNYGIGFGIGGPVLLLVIGYAYLRNAQKPHDLSITLLSFVGTALAIVGAATKSWFVADPAYTRFNAVAYLTQWSLWNVCYAAPPGAPGTYNPGFICSPYGTVLAAADSLVGGADIADATIHEKAKGGLGLILIGLILSGVVILTSLIASKLPIGAKYLRYVTLVLSALSFLALIVGWSVAMSISKNLEGILGVFPLVGFSNGLVIMSWVTLFFTALIQLQGIRKSTLIDVDTLEKDLGREEEDEPQDHTKTAGFLTLCAVIAATIAAATNHWFTGYIPSLVSGTGSDVLVTFGLHRFCTYASCATYPDFATAITAAAPGVAAFLPSSIPDSVIHKGKTALGLTIIGLSIAFIGSLLLFASAGQKKLTIPAFLLIVSAATIQLIGWAAAESMRTSLYHLVFNEIGITVAWSEGLALFSWITLYLISLYLLKTICAKAPATKEEKKEEAEQVAETVAAAVGGVIVAEDVKVEAAPAEPTVA